MSVPAPLYYVYKISFNNTDRIYIGYTSTTIKNRFNEHWKSRKRSRTPLSNYLKNISKNECCVQCLYVSWNKESALEAEISLIKDYQSLINQKGFNSTPGGENPPEGFGGSRWMVGKTEEEIRIINQKKSRKGKENGFFGRSHSKETKERAVKKRIENGSYHSGISKHLNTEEAIIKNNESKMNAAAKRYGYDSDLDFVTHIVDVYQECAGSLTWISNITGSNLITVKKRVSWILEGRYGDEFKEYIENCNEVNPKALCDLQLLGREEFSNHYHQTITKPKGNFDGYTSE